MDDSSSPLFDKSLRRKEVSFLPYSLMLHGLVVLVLTGVLGNWGMGAILKPQEALLPREEIWIDMVEMSPVEDSIQERDQQTSLEDNPDENADPVSEPIPQPQKEVVRSKDLPQPIKRELPLKEQKKVPAEVQTVQTVQVQRTSQASFSLFDSYQAHVHQKILARKFYPKQALRRREEGRVQVSFSIDRSGNAYAVKVSETSFSHALDLAAIKAVQSASPFDVPPEALPASSLKFTVPLVYRLIER